MSVKNKSIEVFIDAIQVIAEKKALQGCFGFMYEPEIPKKLKEKGSKSTLL